MRVPLRTLAPDLVALVVVATSLGHVALSVVLAVLAVIRSRSSSGRDPVRVSYARPSKPDVSLDAGGDGGFAVPGGRA